MSKYDRQRKTKLLKEKRSPEKRLERITRLRREIKFLKQVIPERTKALIELERQVRWARLSLHYNEREIELMEKELIEFETYDKLKK